jgi:crotonobetainyl-CoA:carnitine CoA-transferase CaiB-like acyl-CoA transferase
LNPAKNGGITQRRGLFYNIPNGQGTIPQVGTGIQLDSQSNTPRFPPPKLGEHTKQVLEEMLGLDASTISTLKEKNVI